MQQCRDLLNYKKQPTHLQKKKTKETSFQINDVNTNKEISINIDKKVGIHKKLHLSMRN